MRSCSPGATTAPDSILANTSSYPREELAELWADVGSHLFRVEVLARSAFRHQPRTFSNSRSTRSPQTPSFERGQRERPASSAMRQRALAPAQEPPKRSARAASFVEAVCGLPPARHAGEVEDRPPRELPTDQSGGHPAWRFLWRRVAGCD